MASSKSCASITLSTQAVELTYWRASRPHLTGFSNADYATCNVDRKSVAGYSWSSKKQTCVATSSTEAELHALSDATQEVLHMQAILGALGLLASETLMGVSQSSLALLRRDEHKTGGETPSDAIDLCGRHSSR